MLLAAVAIVPIIQLELTCLFPTAHPILKTSNGNGAMTGNIYPKLRIELQTSMPSKRVHVREYFVRAHERVIQSRRYKIICRGCNQSTERESYGPRPLYCEECRPPFSRTKLTSANKKRPRPVLVKNADSLQAQRSREGRG